MQKFVLFTFLIFTIFTISCKKKDSGPVASFTFTVKGYEADFISTSTDNPTTLTWDFGDSSATLTGSSATHIYKTSGSYNVQLTASNANGSNKKTMQVVVFVPTASFSYTTDGYNVNFTNTSTNNPISLLWNFGDGTPTKTGQALTHTYATSGTYTVTLTSTSAKDTLIAKKDITIKEQIAKIHTFFGDMYMWLYNERPAYKANYIKNVTTGLYDSTTFHRVVPNFVIQGGDSLSKGDDQSQAGTGGPDQMPFQTGNGITHIYGAVGAASLGAKAKGNNWQFYIVTNLSGDHQLDPSYTVFGYIMKGMDVANAIQNQPADPSNSRPLTPIRMSVTILNETKAEILANYGYTVK